MTTFRRKKFKTEFSLHSFETPPDEAVHYDIAKGERVPDNESRALR